MSFHEPHEYKCIKAWLLKCGTPTMINYVQRQASEEGAPVDAVYRVSDEEAAKLRELGCLGPDSNWRTLASLAARFHGSPAQQHFLAHHPDLCRAYTDWLDAADAADAAGEPR